MTALIAIISCLAILPVLNTIANLILLRKPDLPAQTPSVAILIPARNEAAAIGPCVDAALANMHAEIEVIVLDDGSSDDTAAIVKARSARDPRLRLVAGPPLPEGWKGKPHACHVLASLSDRPFYLFVDSDVRLARDAVARLAPADGVDLVSGVPRQRTIGIVETAVVPMINSLIYGYLPIGIMRRMPENESLAAACGQLVMVRAAAYHASGGHKAVAASLHDGLKLARNFRRNGFRTDVVDATHLATCRMYESASAVWNGFSKNATEGMAKPRALPVWTLLLGGGILLPPLLVVFGQGLVGPVEWALLLGVIVLQIVTRLAQAIKCREGLLAVVLHPVGVTLTLAIQWVALVSYLLGKPVMWRGRTYETSI